MNRPVAPPRTGTNFREVETVKREYRRTGLPIVPATAILFLILGILGCPLLSGTGVTASPPSRPSAPADPAVSPPAPSPAAPQKFSREGVVVEFSYEPASKRAGGVIEGEFTDLRFRVTDEAKGKPVRSLRPGAWMDISRPWTRRRGRRPLDCRKKVGLYLQGIVGIRPMLDLNGYFIVVMNREPNLYVIDPFVGMAGRTNLLTTVPLREPATDWTKSADEKRLYVTLNKAGRWRSWTRRRSSSSGRSTPGRGPFVLRSSRTARLLWVGNDAPDGSVGGVTAIDTGALGRGRRSRRGRGTTSWPFPPTAGSPTRRTGGAARCR